MSLAETHNAHEYDDVACRKILAKAIRAHNEKLRERDDVRARPSDFAKSPGSDDGAALRP
jgi:hypothetical protein